VRAIGVDEELRSWDAWREAVSERSISAASACIVSASSDPPPRRPFAAGLPRNGVSVKVSTV